MPMIYSHGESDMYHQESNCMPLTLMESVELNKQYVSRISSVINNAVNEYARVFAFRVDLRFPGDMLDYYQRNSDIPNGRVPRVGVEMSRFVESFKAQIKHDLYVKSKSGSRVYPCNLRVVWCREINESERFHYHLLVLLNKDAYFTLGNYKSPASMANRVVKAWASALALINIEHAKRLVHFPDNHSYFIDRNSAEFSKQLNDVMYRTSYLAKTATKQYGDRRHNFGASIR